MSSTSNASRSRPTGAVCYDLNQVQADIECVQSTPYRCGLTLPRSFATLGPWLHRGNHNRAAVYLEVVLVRSIPQVRALPGAVRMPRVQMQTMSARYMPNPIQRNTHVCTRSSDLALRLPQYTQFFVRFRTVTLQRLYLNYTQIKLFSG